MHSYLRVWLYQNACTCMENVLQRVDGDVQLASIDSRKETAS